MSALSLTFPSTGDAGDDRREGARPPAPGKGNFQITSSMSDVTNFNFGVAPSTGRPGASDSKADAPGSVAPAPFGFPFVGAPASKPAASDKTTGAPGFKLPGATPASAGTPFGQMQAPFGQQQKFLFGQNPFSTAAASGGVPANEQAASATAKPKARGPLPEATATVAHESAPPVRADSHSDLPRENSPSGPVNLPLTTGDNTPAICSTIQTVPTTESKLPGSGSPFHFPAPGAAAAAGFGGFGGFGAVKSVSSGATTTFGTAGPTATTASGFSPATSTPSEAAPSPFGNPATANPPFGAPKSGTGAGDSASSGFGSGGFGFTGSAGSGGFGFTGSAGSGGFGFTGSGSAGFGSAGFGSAGSGSSGSGLTGATATATATTTTTTTTTTTLPSQSADPSLEQAPSPAPALAPAQDHGLPGDGLSLSQLSSSKSDISTDRTPGSTSLECTSSVVSMTVEVVEAKPPAGRMERALQAAMPGDSAATPADLAEDYPALQARVVASLAAGKSLQDEVTHCHASLERIWQTLHTLAGSQGAPGEASAARAFLPEQSASLQGLLAKAKSLATDLDLTEARLYESNSSRVQTVLGDINAAERRAEEAEARVAALEDRLRQVARQASEQVGSSAAVSKRNPKTRSSVLKQALRMSLVFLVIVQFFYIVVLRDLLSYCHESLDELQYGYFSRMPMLNMFLSSDSTLP
ncbi:hypothetical protein H696_01937 [Fonticula alba]|uniref:Uncharacterized protein n=1 Tax=Fonticula alba TaxID=691883 RepID=A0A058ZAM7_FONAL|nr:hypothetical protein H696_01937 [Fonticula alba]KCV70991.1 hypothetical protein H696_01937 [Fonticula alba]|eukprot:XP_009494114.1 hypothetical protein H696_01937 [Fonticula alba]